MKKVLTAAFLLSAVWLQAQQQPSRVFAEIAAGAAMPVGRFADKAYQDGVSVPPGMANTGITASATVGYHLNKSLGVLMTAGYSQNKQDSDPYRFYYSSMWYPSGPLVDATPGSWKQWQFMAGGFYTTPIIGKLSLMAKAVAGICKTAVPSQKWNAYDNYGMPLAWGGKNEESLKAAFCFQLNAGLQYHLTNRWHVLLEANSFNTAPRKEYKYSWSSMPTRPNEPLVTEVRTFKINTIGVLAGIGFRF